MYKSTSNMLSLIVVPKNKQCEQLIGNCKNSIKLTNPKLLFYLEQIFITFL